MGAQSRPCLHLGDSIENCFLSVTFLHGTNHWRLGFSNLKGRRNWRLEARGNEDEKMHASLLLPSIFIHLLLFPISHFSYSVSLPKDSSFLFSCVKGIRFFFNVTKRSVPLSLTIFEKEREEGLRYLDNVCGGLSDERLVFLKKNHRFSNGTSLLDKEACLRSGDYTFKDNNKSNKSVQVLQNHAINVEVSQPNLSSSQLLSRGLVHITERICFTCMLSAGKSHNMPFGSLSDS